MLYSPAWAEINLDAMTHNLAMARMHIGGKAKVLCVVKADAYGHGAAIVAGHLQEAGADYLGVASIGEAAEIRNAGISLPILIFGGTPASEVERLLALNLTQTVHNTLSAAALSSAAAALGKRLRVHIKLDTGMGRLGFSCSDSHFAESAQKIIQILSLPGLDAEGIYTHFAVSDTPGSENERYTQKQYCRFLQMFQAVESQSGYVFSLHHCANSGAIAYHPEWALDMVRLGLALYGVSPMADVIGAVPVMTLKAKITAVRTLEKGETVGYGRHFTAQRPSRIAVLPVGFADGLCRLLSGKVEVLTPYGTASQVGRICMDSCMIDVTDLPEVCAGDEVELFGKEMLCQTAADQGGTIAAEILCGISTRIIRKYFQGGECVQTDNRLSR